MKINKTYKIDMDSLAAMALVNCRMILENAVAMPDDYIERHYGSDSNMCKVAEQYFDLACKIMQEMPPITICEVYQEGLHVHGTDYEEDES